MTPRRSSARAIPSRAAVSPIAEWPPQPWTWRSTNPGATNGLVRRRVSDRATTSPIRPSTIEIRPLATRSSRMSLDPRRPARSGRAGHVTAAISAPWIAAPIAPAERAQLRGDDLDVGERGRVDPSVGARRGSTPGHEISRRRDPTAEDDLVGCEHDDHVGDADAEVAADRRPAPRSPVRRRPGHVRLPPRPSRSRTPRRSGRPG